MKIDKNIFHKYSDGRCSDEERALLEEWFENFNLNDQSSIDEYLLLNHVKNLDNRIKGIEVKSKSKKVTLWRYFAAASILILGFFSSIWLLNREDEKTNSIVNIEDVKAPEQSNAIVILENQKEYNLDSLHVGDTIRTKNYLLTKQENGELNYIQISKTDAPIYNTLKTVSGGISHVKLADGSMIWLNANSELTYPISFEFSEREVFLKGEGYFEISKSVLNKQSRPFFVRGEHYTIQVLGTKFNANLKKGSEIALLEGRVRIADIGLGLQSDANNIDYKYSLSPNEVFMAGHIRKEKNINKYIDWKEGYFDLNDKQISELALDLADWYGVTIKVSPNLNNHLFFGRISRDKSLKEVLDIISEVTPLRYKINNSIITIMNN